MYENTISNRIGLSLFDQDIKGKKRCVYIYDIQFNLYKKALLILRNILLQKYLMLLSQVNWQQDADIDVCCEGYNKDFV